MTIAEREMAKKLFDEAKRAADEAHKKTMAPIWRAFEKAMAAAYKAYDEQMAPAYKAYKKAIGAGQVKK